MDLFVAYLNKRHEPLSLLLRKVAVELDIDTSILSKIEFIQLPVLSELGDLEFLNDGLKKVLKKI